MSKVEINVQPVIDLIKSEIKGLDYVRTFKGRGKKEGHFLIRAAISTDKDLDIDIDVAQMVSNKNYFDSIITDIQNLRDQEIKGEHEKCRMDY